MSNSDDDEQVERERPGAFWRAVEREAPADCGPTFFAWLRDVTTACWEGRAPAWLASLGGRSNASLRVAARRWGPPLRADEVDALEARAGLVLAPDYRAFLEALHTTEGPPGDRALFPDLRASPLADASPGFYSDVLFYAWVNRDWLPAWGLAPATLDEAHARLRPHFARAAPLVPLLGHRALVAAPSSAGNPVLSVHGMDTIAYGSDLRVYLVNELLAPGGCVDTRVDPAQVEAIPFWGAVLGYNGYGPAPVHWNERPVDCMEGAAARQAEFEQWTRDGGLAP